jgi:NAD(P)-dependent dehydrogenase (short-subunit alcohol dehydrogenase family)
MEENNEGETPRLKGRVSIVTGGASGIGLATCRELVKEGATVVLVDLDQSRVAEAVKALQHSRADTNDPGSVVLSLALDVRSEEDMEEMSRRTLQSFDRIDILVASAGILRSKGSTPRMLVDTLVAEWDEVIDTNLKGVFLSNRAVLPAMMQQRSGHIVNISSTSGRQGRAFDSAYCASKFGVIGLSQSAAQEVSRYGIKISTVLPDAVDTPLWQQNRPLPQAHAMLPPERIANLIIYLITLPDDTALIEPVIGSFQTRRSRGRGPTD